MIDGIDHCRKIRNKYAHSYWHDPDMGKALCYVALEELAKDTKPVNDLTNLTFFYIDERLLLIQEEYFKYVSGLLHYVNYEGRLRNKLTQDQYPLGAPVMCCTILRFLVVMAFACLVAPPTIAEEAASPALTFSPWTKFCLTDTCFIGTDGRLEPNCGPLVAAVVIERNGDTKRTLRVTLPARVNLERAVRIIIDQGQAIERPYVGCFANGCMADYAAGAELVDQLKQGKMLVLEAMDKANSPIGFTVPLVDFASAYDGPSKELKQFEASVSDLQAKLDRRKREEEDRKARCETR